MRAMQAADQFAIMLCALLEEHGALLDKLLAHCHQFVKSYLSGGGWSVRRRCHFCTKASKHLRINWIVFGAATNSPGKVAHLARINYRKSHCGRMCGRNQPSLIAPTGFNDQMGILWQTGQKTTLP